MRGRNILLAALGAALASGSPTLPIIIDSQNRPGEVRRNLRNYRAHKPNESKYAPEARNPVSRLQAENWKRSIQHQYEGHASKAVPGWR